MRTRFLGLVAIIVSALGVGVWTHGLVVLVGFGLGLLLGLVWHWWMFAHYDQWIIDNGGRLPK